MTRETTGGYPAGDKPVTAFRPPPAAVSRPASTTPFLDAIRDTLTGWSIGGDYDRCVPPREADAMADAVLRAIGPLLAAPAAPEVVAPEVSALVIDPRPTYSCVGAGGRIPPYPGCGTCGPCRDALAAGWRALDGPSMLAPGVHQTGLDVAAAYRAGLADARRQADDARAAETTPRRCEPCGVVVPDADADAWLAEHRLACTVAPVREPDTTREDALVDVLGNLWLYVDWRYVTRQLTTAQRELFADAVDGWSARLHDGIGEPAVAVRWWRDDTTTGHCGHPVNTSTGPLYLDGRLPGVLFCGQACAQTAVDRGEAATRRLSDSLCASGLHTTMHDCCDAARRLWATT